MTKRPAWLAERITRAARQARTDDCPDCQAPTLVGLDSDVCGWPARTEAATASWLEAVAGFLAGLGVYQLAGSDLGRELHRCDDYHLTSRPESPLVLEHRCPDSGVNDQPQASTRGRGTR